ncbi:helix-turn-helix transcriptional regulator [Paenibacillus sp. J2TS4]|uniref:helix-turn-helix transcriptional regulator n=1 Tax=Paenibacillus sp. J2TS4 TaxID=2807194 RepID=UPI001BCA8554|nr:AraC family transcriptional regulator [Paenibacillus sp. J2TS4]
MYNEHVRMVKGSIRFIEENLTEELSLERVSREASFSMYHFHRLFQAYVGETPSEYIRKRRLACAAAELISTDRRILEVALEFQFESQEAFTRAFKRVYHMTPGKYRKYVLSLLNRGEKENRMEGIKQEPYGWMLTGSHPHLYSMGVDRIVTHQGRSAGYLVSESHQMEGFATMMQMFKAKNYVGKRLRFTGFAKSERVDGWAGLWMRIDGKDGDLLGFDNMGNRPITGTTSWSPYSIVLDIPKDSQEIAFGVLLYGAGKIWVDSLRLDEVDDKVPTTNIESPDELPDGPVNLSFDEAPEGENGKI